MTITGGCLCGSVRYTCEAEPLLCVTCHCKNCQRQAGSALSVIIGVTVRRQFCPECGSPVFTRVDSPPGMMFIKAGTLDDTSILKPAFHCYAKSKQDWVDLGDLPAFATVPEGL
jgi:hypothetical protein